jgi:hypothetical protein
MLLVNYISLEPLSIIENTLQSKAKYLTFQLFPDEKQIDFVYINLLS